MTVVLQLVLMLGLPLLLGAALLRLLGIGIRSDPVAFFGWAWIAGCLGTGLVVFAWLWTGLGTASVLAPALAIAVLTLLAWRFGRRVDAVPAARVRAPMLERAVFGVVLAALVVFVIERIVTGTLIPVLVGDEAEFWAFKSKILYASGGFNEQFRATMHDPLRLIYHKDYPVLNLLLQVWSFACSGRITHVVNRLPIQVFALANLLVVAGALRRVVRPGLAALLVVLLIAPSRADGWAHLAMSDLLVSVGVVAAFDAFSRWYRNSEIAWFRLGAVAVAALLWSKNEGLFYSICTGAAILLSVLPQPSLLRSRRLWRAVPWLLVPGAVFALHLWFNAHHGFVSAFSESEDGTLLALFRERFTTQLTTVLDYFARNVVFSPEHSNLLPVCFFGLVVGFPVVLWKSSLRVPTLALLGASAGLIAIFIAHPTPPPSDIMQQLVNGAQRVSFQLFPSLVLWVGAAIGLVWPKCAPESASTVSAKGVG